MLPLSNGGDWSNGRFWVTDGECLAGIYACFRNFEGKVEQKAHKSLELEVPDYLPPD